MSFVYEENECSLVVLSTGAQDGGVYTCTARNLAGEVSCKAELAVHSGGQELKGRRAECSPPGIQYELLARGQSSGPAVLVPLHLPAWHPTSGPEHFCSSFVSSTDPANLRLCPHSSVVLHIYYQAFLPQLRQLWRWKGAGKMKNSEGGDSATSMTSTRRSAGVGQGRGVESGGPEKLGLRLKGSRESPAMPVPILSLCHHPGVPSPT